MHINSEKLGNLEIDEKLIFEFVKPILGYPDMKKYTLIKVKDDDIFLWLQSIEDSTLAFPVGICETFNINYSFEIDDESIRLLKIKDVSDILTFNIVTIPENNPHCATINLLAPIVVNTNENLAMQLILSGSNLPVKEKIFK